MTVPLPDITDTRPGAISSLKRWLPVLALAGLIAAAYLFGLHRYLSLEAIVDNRNALKDFVAAHWLLSILIYATVYIAVVALSLPGSALMTILGGFLFGWYVSAPITVLAATAGAAVIFQIVKFSFGAFLAERASPFVQRLSSGFAEDAFNYLLFLRLVPAFPFFAVNAVAGLCRIGFPTFVIATLIGIIPATFVFSYLGSGLDGIIEAQIDAQRDCVSRYGAAICNFNLDASSLLTPQILVAFAALGALALAPVAIKRWKRSA